MRKSVSMAGSMVCHNSTTKLQISPCISAFVVATEIKCNTLQVHIVAKSDNSAFLASSI